MNRLFLLSLVLVLTLPGATPLPTGAQEATDGDFLRKIMSDPDWIGNEPENAYWSDDGTAVFYFQERVGEDFMDLMRLALVDGAEPQVITDDVAGYADFDGGSWSRDRNLKVYSRKGDIYMKDMADGSLRQLLRTVDREGQPQVLLDGRIAFQRENTLFVRDLEKDLEAQIAELRTEDEPEEKEPKGYLAESEDRLIRWVREQREDRQSAVERARMARAMDKTQVPPPFYLGKNVIVNAMTLAGNGEWLLATVSDKQRDRGQRGKMPNYISETGYTTVRDIRPKVGTGDGKGNRLVLVDLVNRVHHQLDASTLPGITDDPLAAVREANKKDDPEAEKAEETDKKDTDKKDTDKKKDKGKRKKKDQDASEDQDAEAEKKKEAKPREVTWFRALPSPDGESIVVMARSNDNKDRWLVLIEGPSATNAEDGAEGDEDEGLKAPPLKTIHRLSDEAWINWSFNDFGWLPDSRHIYFLSEETGYSQLYLYEIETGETRRLTDGDYVVGDPEVSPDGRFIYYRANVDHPGVYEIYRTPVNSEKMATEQLTNLGGLNEARLSPDGKQLLITHSSLLQPPDLYIQDAAPDATAKRLTTTSSDEFHAVGWVKPEIVAVPSSHQEDPIYSRYYPPSSDRMTGDDGPAAVIFIHGAGYLQNAHKGWSGYFREFMFHTHLSRQGYAVLDMDYRASRGYGRDWRTAIYRQMGTPEVEDLADGVDWLVEEHGIDRDRIGVYGGSYGGFLTFMALFNEPDLFAAGAALRPVTDWAHYNHPYTSNILNTPEVDPEAYQRSSPIEFAEGLTKPLLICTGMQDGNVLFQDSVRLVQRLIELEKENWELAVYPIEGHGFVEPSSWLDEYRRIFKLFEQNLNP